jgi:hypothetical protein
MRRHRTCTCSRTSRHESAASFVRAAAEEVACGALFSRWKKAFGCGALRTTPDDQRLMTATAQTCRHTEGAREREREEP